MKIARITIHNFRGIASADLLIPSHAVLVGDNNSGKSTVLEAIDLVLGPERLSRRPIIDEHDFYAGRYIDETSTPVQIKVSVTIIDLTEEQVRYFKDHIEWWNTSSQSLLDGPPPEATDDDAVVPALRLGFTGMYDPEEDDFVGSTFFFSPTLDDGGYVPFRTVDKRLCGFLFLRTLRTGSRALSLERGSLLDIILRLQEKRLQMWEDVLAQLRLVAVAENPELGITSTLADVQDAVRSFVPAEWASNPHMRVSDLTRESLRRSLTVFMGTGATRNDGSEYAAPFQHQGTGTINTLVLALLSMIAELKQNVIFAMEEPEIALPPHTQKRIVESLIRKSAQVLFTSHSPYVLEEFSPSMILVLRRENGSLSHTAADFPPSVKPKAYRTQFRTRFCEALLARRVLITEGRTEYDAFPAAARRLNELHPEDFRTLESLGFAVVNAETDSQIAALGQHFSALGKDVFAVFDRQSAESRTAIEAVVPHCYESPEAGFETLVVKHTHEDALRRYAISLVEDGSWPTHLAAKTPTAFMPLESLQDALFDFFRWSKGAGDAADLLAHCSREEMPRFVVDTLSSIQGVTESSSDAPRTAT